MNKFSLAVCLAVLTCVSSLGYAQTIMYAQRPAWMGKDLPQQISCKKVKDKDWYGRAREVRFDCRVPEFKAVRGYRIVLTDGQQQWTHNEPATYRGACKDGICFNTSSEELMGQVQAEFSSRVPAAIGYSATRNYYVVLNDQTLTAYKRGTGPYAQNFAPYVIANEIPAATSNAASEELPSLSAVKGVDEVWCNPRGDMCTVTTRKGMRDYSREQLPEHLPMAKVSQEFGSDHFCDGAVCSNQQNEFIGLNPFYYN